MLLFNVGETSAEALAEQATIAAANVHNVQQLENEARAIARASGLRKRRSPCDEDGIQIYNTYLFIIHGEDMALHTIVDLSSVPSTTEYFMIANVANHIIGSMTQWGIEWSSKFVKSRSRGFDKGGYLGATYGYYSAAAIYHGPEMFFEDIDVHLLCEDQQFYFLQQFLIDVAFYTLGKMPNAKVNKCFSSRNFQKSVVLMQRYNVRDTTWSLCPLNADAILAFQTEFWQDAQPTPLQPNSCVASKFSAVLSWCAM